MAKKLPMYLRADKDGSPLSLPAAVVKLLSCDIRGCHARLERRRTFWGCSESLHGKLKTDYWLATTILEKWPALKKRLPPRGSEAAPRGVVTPPPFCRAA